MQTQVERGRTVLTTMDGGAAQMAPEAPDRAAELGPAYAAIAVGALAVLGATAVGLRWAARPPAVRTITMGPGGWVSFKGVKPPPLGPRRPWWAVLLRAQPVPGT